MAKRVTRIFFIVLLVIVGLLTAFFVAVRYPSVQTYLAQKATGAIAKSLNTKVSIERVAISFFSRVELVNFYMEDLNRDTLIYAQSLEVRVSLFDLWNKKVNIQGIMLSGAKVYLHRDSVSDTMNLALLLRQSSEKKSGNSTDSTTFTWDVNLNEVTLKATDFRYLDEQSHTDVQVFVPELVMDIDRFSLPDKLIDIDKLKIDGAQVAIGLLKRITTPDTDSAMLVHFMVGGMKVTFDELQIANTKFKLTDYNTDTIKAKGMDFKHLDIKHIAIMAENGTITADTILADVKHVAARDRSGFQLDSLRGHARVSIHDITLSELYLKTPNSTIGNYLSFRFDVYRDFKSFLHDVNINAELSGSTVSLQDLNYFIPALDKMQHNRFSISGVVEGTVNNLKGKDIAIKNNASVFKGSFFTQGLPDIYETFVSLKVKQLSTNIADVKRFYPSLKYPVNLNTLGTINYTGSLDGFVTDFVSNGKLTTAIGTATTDVNFKYDKKNNKAFYKGDLALNEFNLGRYFADTVNLGKISLVTKVNGGGLTLESLKAELDGTIASINLRQHEYQNIIMNGFVLNKSFNGSLLVRDEYLDGDFNGKADLSGAMPAFRFNATVRKAVLYELNLSKHHFSFEGKFKSDFTGNHVDNLSGNIRVDDLRLTRDSISAYSKYIDLSVKNRNSKKAILLNADFAEAEMEGHFSFRELPKALLHFANYSFTKNYTDTAYHLSNQNFTLDLRVFEPKTLTQIIHPKFYLLRNSRIQSSFSSVDHQLQVTATVPELEFGSFNVKRGELNTTFENRKFNFMAMADKVYNGDSLMLDTLSLRAITLDNEDVRFDIAVADKKHYNYANITSFLTPQEGSAVVRLEPSNVKLGNYNWHFNEGNMIFIEGKKIITNNLIFKTNAQSVYITSYLKGDTSTSFKLTLDNTELGDFMGIFTQKMNDLHGAVNGKLVVEDVFAKPQLFADLVIDEFTLGNELVGDINIESRLDEVSKKIQLYASVKSVTNYVEAKGYVSIDPSNPDLKIDVNASRLGLNFLNYRFFDRYVKDCRGYALVNASVVGTLKKPLLKGSVTLVDDTVTVSFLNTTYHIDKHTVELDEHGFNIGAITIFDVNNNPIYGTGRINHESFRDFAFDLRVNTPNAQFLNTTVKHSPNFYGVAYGKGNISFNGPVKNIEIKGYAQTRVGTWCSLPINPSYEINRYGFYRFVNNKPGSALKQANVPQLKLTGVNFTLDLDVTPDARMDIILDPVSGDVLTSYGRGNLKIEIPRNGNTSIYGTYEIEQGKYLFTLQSVVNKPFILSKGGTITFTGDVYKATLNAEATYEVRSSMTDLISDLIRSSSSGDELSRYEDIARSRVPVKLQMMLTGVLEHPNIRFDIKAIDVDPAIKNFVDQRLALLKTNEKELNNQVFGLLVLQRFLPSNQAAGTGNSFQGYVGGAAANTVSEFLSSQFSNYLNNLIGYTGTGALQDFNIRIGWQQYDQSNPESGNAQQASSITRRELQVAIQQQLLNNRLTINAGGNIDFGGSQQVQNGDGRTVIPTGDFQLQYALTKDGRWRAKAFNRTNYDYFNTRNSNRTGVGISFTKEFDKPAELFKRKKKKKEADKKPETDANKPNE